MKRLPSIRQRLSRTLVVISLVWGVAVSAVVWVAVRHEVDELLDNTLQESAEILYGLLLFNAAQLPMQGGGSLPAPAHDERTVWQIVSAGNEVLLRSHHAPLVPLAARQTAGLSSRGDEWRVFGIPFDATGRILYVAQRGSERSEARLEAAELTAGAALAVGLLCALWLRSRVRRELDPINEMSAAVAHFDPLQPDPVLATATRAELVPMHDAILGLGERLAQRIANERAFSDHAAHALRTPLAGMVAQLAVAQRKSPPEAQPYLKRTREAAGRLGRVVNALLTLFRTGAEVRWQQVDIADLVAHLPFETLSITASDHTQTQCDPDLLAAALMNLLDNSQRHGATMVTVSAREEPRGTSIIVSDDGTGLPDSELARLQAALDEQAYEDQMGLGLMLADLVARAHGGRLRLIRSASGCTVEIGLGEPPAAGARPTLTGAAA
jgi:two-component system OmpR family sensor kinase